MSQMNFSSVMIDSKSNFSSGLKCYLNKNDERTLVLQTKENSDGKVIAATVYSLDQNEEIKFEDISIEKTTKTKIVMIALGLQGTVASLALNIDSRGNDHTGILILRHFNKSVEEMWVHCVLK